MKKRIKLNEICFFMDYGLTREKLRNKMEEKSWSISQVERKVGLGPTTFRNFITGKTKNPKVETVIAFAKALDITTSELMESQGGFQKKDKKQLWGDSLLDLKWDVNVFIKSVQKFNEIVLDKKTSVTNRGALEAIKHIYYFLYPKTHNKAEEEFNSWLIDNFIELKNEIISP